MRWKPLFLMLALPWPGHGGQPPRPAKGLDLTATPGLASQQPAPRPSATPSPLSLQVVAPVCLGGLLVQACGGRVTLTERGSLLPEGNGVLPGSAPPAAYGRVLLTGPANTRYRLTAIPLNPVLRSGAGAVQLASFRFARPFCEGVFGPSGTAEVDLGGTLDIPAQTPAGRYSGVSILQLTVPGWPAITQPLPIACQVRSPLVLANLDALEFGCVIPCGGGDYRVGPDPGSSPVGKGPQWLKGPCHGASFRFTGPARTALHLILPSQITLTSAGGSITVSDFTCDQDFRNGLAASGVVFHVGATLHVAADQAPGTYQGTFPLMVVYP